MGILIYNTQEVNMLKNNIKVNILLKIFGGLDKLY